MADKQIFPSNTVNSNSWKFTYSDKTTTDSSYCSVSTSSRKITIKGDSDTGTKKGSIKGNYLLKVDLTNYTTLKASVSSCSIHTGDAGDCRLVVQSARDIDTGVISSKTIREYGGSSDYSPSIDVSGLSGLHYIGIDTYVNAYNMGDAYVSVTCTISLVEANYTVTLNKGAGISAVSPAASNSVTPGNSITIDATVSNGYTWKNWTGSATLTNKKNTITPSGNASYTANATANTYTLTFNANGGTTSIASKSVTYNSAYGTLPTPTRTGYTFNGWYTAASGGTKKTSSSTYSTIGNSTLYAQWSPITYTIAFNSNGGSGAMNDMSCSYNAEYTLTANSFTRTNYMFIGWATSANGEVVYKDRESIKNLSNTATTITLYAVWQQQGTVRIMINNEYKTAQAYIFKDGFWLLTQPWTYSSGWKINGG